MTGAARPREYKMNNPMKKPYWGLWSLLLAAFVFFAVLSLWPDGIRIGGLDIKTGSFASYVKDILVISDNDGGNSKLVVADGSSKAEAPDAWRAPLDTTAKNILFFGDSMLEGLAPRLAKYCEKNGHSLVEVIWYSSSTLVWGESDRLSQLIEKYHPDYIFVCLGANELFVPGIKSARRPHLKKILADIGNIPYVWIGPPNWDKDTGINDMLADNLARGCFYLSANDEFERSRDGAHPTRASAAKWMDRVIDWLNTSGAHPIRLENPGEGNGHADHIVVYQPPV